MARITMRNSQKATFAEVFEVYISAVTARGVKDKTIATYKQHFHAISKRLDVSMPINRLTSTVLDNMILQMRKEGLSDSSIKFPSFLFLSGISRCTSKSRSSNSPSKFGRSKEKSRSKEVFFTASPPFQPVPHLFPFSTVLRQFLGVRSWFVRGSTAFFYCENTCLYPYRTEADRSNRFEHLPSTHHHALAVFPSLPPPILKNTKLCIYENLSSFVRFSRLRHGFI